MFELVEQRGDVVAQGLEAHRTVGVRRAAVALQLDRDHLAGLRQRLEQRGHFADRHQAAVQQHQRFALPVDLVIELDAVHVGIAGGDGRQRRAGPMFPLWLAAWRAVPSERMGRRRRASRQCAFE